MMLSYDLTIVGGGMVGLTLAASLAKSNLKIAIVENSEPSSLTEAPALRVSAISAASRTIFEKIAVWQHINPKRITPYDTMFVWEKDSFGKIEFDAQQVEAEKLGFSTIFVSKYNKISLKNTAIKIQLVSKIEDLVEFIV